MSFNNEPTSLSYTNKDFNSIYVELLEYAKQLSYKWDPTASAESDPGVVLLKLAALIGDKDSYNIDKNILELMPASVTQIPAARQLFEQCGYSMKHYRSAEGTLNLTLIKDPVEDSSNITHYTLPMFTMFTDTDSSVVYTASEKVQLTKDALIPVNVIEGTAIEYTINNDKNITLMNLDSKNRLYFTDTNIAENGIFITNIYEDGNTNYDEWYRVDNLEIQPLGERCYKFGITLDTNVCYIQFPDDVDLLFNGGVNITYIKTSGLSGNVAARRLNNFFTDVVASAYDTTTVVSDNISLTVENVSITNPSPILSGQDPETIDSAYKSYKRVKDTFDTLVTLKDYTDYMVSQNKASNGYVCDRTNDIQHVYKLLKAEGNSNKTTTVISKDGENPSMTAFDLVAYPLRYVGEVSDRPSFDATFTLSTNFDYPNFLEATGAKSIQHEFKEFDPGKILMIKNKYNINAHVIPRQKLSPAEMMLVSESIYKALFNALNSKEMTFGEEVPYDLLYETINNSDARIKAASIDYPEFETYAVYLEEQTIKELRIDSDLTEPTDTDTVDLWNDFRAEIFAKNILSGASTLYDPDTTFMYGVNQDTVAMYEEIETLTTSTSVQLKPAEDSSCLVGEVRENENVIFTAPNLIIDNRYSSYVKYIYHLNEAIGADDSYQLNSEEGIILFYSESSDSDAYKYVKYGTGTIISPNFLIPQTNLSFTDRDWTTVSNNCSDKGTITSDNEIYNIIKNQLIGTASDKRVCLTGTQEIQILKPNKIQINYPETGFTNIYWMLNTKDNVLFAENESKYMLKSGEYFLYANKDLTTVQIRGEGNIIERDGFDGVWSIKNPVSYSDFLIQGIESITNWKTIELSNDKCLYETETKRVQVGPGNEIILERIDGSDELSPITFTSAVETPLAGYKVSYRDVKSGVTNTLDVIEGDEDISWKATAILNLDVSNTKPQKLLPGQTISWSGMEIPTNDGDDTTSHYFLTNKTVNLLGGTNLDVTSYNLNTNETNNLDILYYTSTNNDGANESETTFVSTVTITPADAETETTILNFALLPGNYLLHIFSPDATLDSLKVEGSSISELFTGVAGIYKLSTKESSNITLTVSSKSSTSDSYSLQIDPLFRYTTETLGKIGDSFEDKLLDKLKELDPDSLFDYTYIPENNISNPLKATSFHLKNHFYNKFTIDQWSNPSDKSDQGIVIVNNIR